VDVPPSGPQASVVSQSLARIRVLVLADIRLYREGLADVLDRQPAVAVVAVCAAVPEAIEDLGRCEADVALLGLSGGETRPAAAALAKIRPETRVVALAIDETEDVLAVLEAGAAGYVPKEASLPDLVSTIQSVARGEMPCSPRIAAGLSRRLAELAPESGSVLRHPPLTLRERQVMALVGEELSNKEIAQRLCIEVTTVKNHVHNVLEKLQVRRRGDAVAALRGEQVRGLLVS
jgi:two-component system, NarL family, nitrate/nitrite response regulator NarL